MGEITNAEELNAAVREKDAAVLFYATWCPFCRVFKPVFEKMEGKAKKNGYEPMEVIIDDESNPLWDIYSIEVIPTVLFFKGGKVERRLDGKAGIGLSEEDLAEVLKD